MLKNRTRKLTVLVIVGVIASAMTVQAAAPDTIKTRQDGLKEMGKAFKVMLDEMKAGKLSAETVKDTSAKITKTADAMANWFPEGSGPEAGVKTAAKPEIWTDRADFDSKREKFVEAAGKFAEIASAGDLTAVGGGVRGLGGACKGCHDKYRVKED